MELAAVDATIWLALRQRLSGCAELGYAATTTDAYALVSANSLLGSTGWVRDFGSNKSISRSLATAVFPLPLAVMNENS